MKLSNSLKIIQGLYPSFIFSLLAATWALGSWGQWVDHKTPTDLPWSEFSPIACSADDPLDFARLSCRAEQARKQTSPGYAMGNPKTRVHLQTQPKIN